MTVDPADMDQTVAVLAHVEQVVAVNLGMHNDLWAQAKAAGFDDYNDFLAVVEGQVGVAARMGVHAQLVEMAKNWQPDQWRAARESFA